MLVTAGSDVEEGGLAAVRMNDKWGFVNPDGQMVIAPSYDEVFDFSEYRAVVRQDEIYFVIDKHGNNLLK